VSSLDASVAARLDELAPLVRRSVTLDAGALVRLRCDAETAAVLVRLPFQVLAARTVRSPGAALDATVGAADLLAWLDGERADPPERRDTEWRGGVPPSAGWRRLDAVPDAVIRGLVRTGALALRDAADREGVPGAEPRAEVADALLDSVVLTVEGDGAAAEITLRTLSALTRMGFLARDSHAAIATAGRWTRVAAQYGSVYAERPGALNLLR
jgi:hypothetical protein